MEPAARRRLLAFAIAVSVGAGYERVAHAQDDVCETACISNPDDPYFSE